MKTTIDGAGRLVIPKELRRRAGLHAGGEVNVRCRDGIIELEPANRSVRLVQHGPLLVAVAEAEAAPLTADEVEEIREALRQERAGVS